jgi:Ankyrin repeats (3 copies)
VSYVVHGGNVPFYKWHCIDEGEDERDVQRLYDSILNHFVHSDRSAIEGQALEDFLLAKKKQHQSRHQLTRFLDYKIYLLRDDDTLGNRLKLVDVLVTEARLPPCNVVDAVQWRQCGAVRWVVQRSYIHLNKIARSEAQLVQREHIVTFLGDGEIPAALTTGEFLVFAAVEFDDLQTVVWLVKAKNIHVERIVCDCNGWTVLHACAFYGRTEIAHWLIKRHGVESLLSEQCHRRTCNKLGAAHIAVQRGFTQLADFLLAWGCPSKDRKGEIIHKLAQRSSHRFVREWGEEKEKPHMFEKDIQILLQLLVDETVHVDEVKQHIAKSKCLDVETWEECGVSFFEPDSVGPLGLTHFAVLKLCCARADSEFVVWLFEPLTSSTMYDSVRYY